MIKLKGIGKSYDGGAVALKGVNLTLPDKGMVFVVGKSGSGKSTLLNILGGLDVPTEGEMSCDGRAVDGESLEDYRRNRVSFIYQDYQLLSEMTVAENVALAAEIVGNAPSRDEVEGLLEKVGLSEYADRDVRKLSGGEKQRVSIARGLMKADAAIFADEPTGNLDSENGENVFRILKKLSEERLVVVVSHDEDAAEKYSDFIVRIKDGEIYENNLKETAAEIKRAPFTYNIKPMPFKTMLRLSKWSKGRKSGKRLVYCIISVVLLTLGVLSYAMLSTPPARSLAALAGRNEDGFVRVGATYVAASEKDQEYLKQKTKLNFVPITDMSSSDRMFRKWSYGKKELYGQEFYEMSSKTEVAPWTMENAAIFGDFSEFDIKIIAGEVPKSAFEVAVPKTFADVVIDNGYYNKSLLPAVKGNRLDSKSNDIVNPLKYDDFIGLPFYMTGSVYTYTISAVFEDNSTLKKEWRGLSDVEIDELSPKDEKKFYPARDAIMHKTVLFNESAKGYFRCFGTIGNYYLGDQSISSNVVVYNDVIARLPETLKGLKLGDNEIIVSQNISEAYGLLNGSQFVLTSFSPENLSENEKAYYTYTVKGIYAAGDVVSGAPDLITSKNTFMSMINTESVVYETLFDLKNPSEAKYARIIAAYEQFGKGKPEIQYIHFEGGFVNYYSQFQDAQEIFGDYVGPIIFAISMFLLLIFIALIVDINIDQKSKELGVMKALGATKGTIKNLFLLQTGLLVGFCFVVGSVLGGIGIALFNAIAGALTSVDYFMAAFYYPDNFVVVLALFAGAAAFAVLFRIRKMFRKSSADIMRGDE